MVANTMTKHEEVAALIGFWNALPNNCYLRDYLDGSVEIFRQQVESDMVFPTHEKIRVMRDELKSIQKQCADARDELERERKKVAEVQRDLRGMKQEMDSVFKSIERIDEAMSMARHAKRDVEKLMK